MLQRIATPIEDHQTFDQNENPSMTKQPTSGAWFKSHRRFTCQMSINDLVAKTGVSKGTISKFENGANITTENLARLLDAVGLNMAWVTK